jgi:hypothetical protein
LLLQIVFISLQALDFVTTLIVLRMGGSEANPLVSRFMLVGSLQGLLFTKVLALTIAVVAVRARKYRVLRVVNVVFAGVVLWNLFVIVGTVIQRHGH